MGFLKSSIKSVGTLLLADFLFYGVAQSATPIFYERIDYMKKIRSYTSIWSVEKVLYSINDFRLPFPITFTQMTWFVVSLFAVMILGNLPPLSMIEGAFLKYFGIPVAFTWFMSTKTFDGKKALWIFEVCHCLCTATKADLCRKKSNAWQKPATRSHYSS